MTIKAPKWVVAQGGIPTPKGWKHPKRNEILLGKKFTQAQIDDYLGVASTPATPTPAPTGALDWYTKDVNQDGAIDDLESLTKNELEELGRDNGVELDRRKSRSTLIDQMRSVLLK